MLDFVLSSVLLIRRKFKKDIRIGSLDNTGELHRKFRERHATGGRTVRASLGPGRAGLLRCLRTGCFCRARLPVHALPGILVESVHPPSSCCPAAPLAALLAPTSPGARRDPPPRASKRSDRSLCKGGGRPRRGSQGGRRRQSPGAARGGRRGRWLGRLGRHGAAPRREGGTHRGGNRLLLVWCCVHSCSERASRTLP